MDNLVGIISSAKTLTGSLEEEQKLSGTLEKADVIYKDDYEQLKNKPFINGVELIGNKTTEDLGDVALTNLEIFNLIQIAKGRA